MYWTSLALASIVKRSLQTCSLDGTDQSLIKRQSSNHLQSARTALVERTQTLRGGGVLTTRESPDGTLKMKEIQAPGLFARSFRLTLPPIPEEPKENGCKCLPGCLCHGESSCSCKDGCTCGPLEGFD